MPQQPKCCVQGCVNSFGKGFKVYRVPSVAKKPYELSKWLQNAGLVEANLPKDPRFCEVNDYLMKTTWF